jgi:hypothetical protein
MLIDESQDGLDPIRQGADPNREIGKISPVTR